MKNLAKSNSEILAETQKQNVFTQPGSGADAPKLTESRQLNFINGPSPDASIAISITDQISLYSVRKISWGTRKLGPLFVVVPPFPDVL